jgi:hypothetical protein
VQFLCFPDEFFQRIKERDHSFSSMDLQGLLPTFDRLPLQGILQQKRRLIKSKNENLEKGLRRGNADRKKTRESGVGYNRSSAVLPGNFRANYQREKRLGNGKKCGDLLQIRSNIFRA